MAGILIVYFSRTGVTETVARELARGLGADLEPLTPDRSYPGAGGFLRGVFESLRRVSPPIASGRNPQDYALVVIGSPVWAGRLAPPVRTWLRRHRGHFRDLAAFCTSGSGAANAQLFQEIETLSEAFLRHTLSLSQGDVQSGRAQPRIDQWRVDLARMTSGRERIVTDLRARGVH